PQAVSPTLGREAGGAGAQGVCYNEDGLPERYRGNLFFCDPVRQCVIRFEVRRSGGTFAIARRSSVVTKGRVAEVHPIALATTAEGTGFWIVDRSSNETRVARLYRLTYTAEDHVRPAPSPRGDDISAQIAALDHPALSVRLTVQRTLARRGEAAVPSLVQRLR